MNNTLKIILALILLALIFVWILESKWMEDNWPEIQMDFIWNDGKIEADFR